MLRSRGTGDSARKAAVWMISKAQDSPVHRKNGASILSSAEVKSRRGRDGPRLRRQRESAISETITMKTVSSTLCFMGALLFMLGLAWSKDGITGASSSFGRKVTR